jgi:hypothetical protein
MNLRMTVCSAWFNEQLISKRRRANPLDRTNLSRLNHLEFLGLALKNLQRRLGRMQNTSGMLRLTERTKHVSLVPYPWVHL